MKPIQLELFETNYNPYEIIEEDITTDDILDYLFNRTR